jgi:hypothetical protein
LRGVFLDRNDILGQHRYVADDLEHVAASERVLSYSRREYRAVDGIELAGASLENRYNLNHLRGCGE